MEPATEILPAIRPAVPFALHQATNGLIQDFLSGRAATTLRAYSRDLEDFRAFIGPLVGAASFTLNQAACKFLIGGQGEANRITLAYKANLVERKLRAATINRRLAALRSLVKLARTLGLVAWTLEIPSLKAAPYRDTRGPGRNGYASLLEELESRTDAKAKRDRAVLRLLYDLALRRGEVVSLDVEHLDLKTGTVAVLGKGKTERETLTLAPETKAALAAWIQARGEAPGPLFVNFDHARKGARLSGTSLYRMVRDLGAAAGLKVRPHGLRHAAITEACKVAQAAGIGLEEVLDFSRHADVKTLMLYRDRERNVQGRLAALVAAGARYVEPTMERGEQ